MPFVKGWIATALVGSEQTLDGQAADIDGEREAGTLFIEVLCLPDALRRRLEIVLWRELHGFRFVCQVFSQPERGPGQVQRVCCLAIPCYPTIVEERQRNASAFLFSSRLSSPARRSLPLRRRS